MSHLLSALQTALSDRYQVERELGRGGMATVFLAHDRKHDREVAIKVLLPELSAAIGSERFLREIRTIASLQHPHILPLFDSGKAELGAALSDVEGRSVAGEGERAPSTSRLPVDTALYYVMPFVEGESLRDRLDRDKQLPVADAVRIAREVASALDYAHRHGVIHRDIKPANVLLHDGSALVSDFGVALPVSSPEGARLTEIGVSLGTPHYMSPEQATGERELTARSDVYSLGAMTDEMLAGDPPFTGSTAQAIVSSLVTESPRPLTAHRHTVPAHVEAAVLTALEKLPADRFQSAAAFAAAMAAPSPLAALPPTGWRVSGRLVTAAAVLAVLALLAGYGLGRMGGGTAGSGFSVGAMRKLTWDDGMETLPALSPDGRSMAYVSGQPTRMRVYLRQVAGGRALPVTDDSTLLEWSPRWSGDGSRLLFVTSDGVFSTPAGGGPARQEVPGAYGAIASATWAPADQRIAFAVGDTLFLRAEDGTVRPLARLDQPAMCRWGPQDLIACAAGNPFYANPGVGFGNLGSSRIVTVRVRDGAVHTVSDTAATNQSPVWIPGGWLLYLSNRDGPSDVYGVRIDEDGAVLGPQQRLTTGLNAAAFSASRDGARIAFASSAIAANVWSLPIPDHPPATVAQAVPVTSGTQVVESISISRDGRWLLYDSDIAGNADIYRMRLPDGRPEQLTSAGTDEFSPGLSPDGRELAFHAWRGTSREIFIKPLDGSATLQVTSTPNQEARPRWSPDGSALTWWEVAGGVWVSRRGPSGEWTARRVVDGGFWSAWSPDGRWLSYTSHRDGGQPMVVAADSGAPRALMPGTDWPRVTTSGWSEDGRTVYFKGLDASGHTGIWALPRTGGSPSLMATLDGLRLTPERHTFTVGNGRFYFALSDRQSDIWLMDLTRPDR